MFGELFLKGETMSLTGQCLCGVITYELKNPPAMTGVCHCKNCQRQAGSAFSTLAGVAKTDFVLNSGQMKVYRDSETDTGNTVERHFCGECGSPIYSAVPDSPDVLFIKTGTMDDTSSFTPQFHVWSSSKQDWVELEDGVPAMQKTEGLG